MLSPKTGEFMVYLLHFSQESRQITKVNCVKKGYNRRSPRGWLEHEETEGKREDL